MGSRGAPNWLLRRVHGPKNRLNATLSTSHARPIAVRFGRAGYAARPVHYESTRGTQRLVLVSAQTAPGALTKCFEIFCRAHNRSAGTPSSRTESGDPSDPPEAGSTDALQSKNEIWTIWDPSQTVHLNPSSWIVHGVQHSCQALVQTPLRPPRLTL